MYGKKYTECRLKCQITFVYILNRMVWPLPVNGIDHSTATMLDCFFFSRFLAL